MPAKYVFLARELKQELEQMRAKGQAKLPAENALADQFRVSRQTVRQALALLEQQGLIEKRRGSGSYLCEADPASRRIAVIATSLSDYIFPSLLKDIQACLAAHGYEVVVHATENSLLAERTILQKLLLEPPAGVLIEGCKTALPNPNAELYRQLEQREIPLVFLHGRCREMAQAVCVGDDNAGGGYRLAEHLIRAGHRRIAGIFKSDDVQGPERAGGVLCAMRRPLLLPVEQVCAEARRVAVLEGIVDSTNIGAIFRSAAALSVDAVLLTPSCCDPLCRRAARVSMGTVFQVPWTRIGDTAADWPRAGMQRLHAMGFHTVAMALSDTAVSIEDPRLAAWDKLAIVLGTEGDGLAAETIAACDDTVCIPMAHGVDSLNVAAASAVAFWQLRAQ